MHNHAHTARSQGRANNNRFNNNMNMMPGVQHRDERTPTGMAHSTIYKAASMAPHPASQVSVSIDAER